MVILRNVPPPFSDPIARPKRQEFGNRPDPKEGLMTDAWQQYESGQNEVLDSAPARIASVTLTSQIGAIAATDMTNGLISAGLYLVSYYARITTVDTGIGQSLQVSIDWTDSVVQTFTGTLLNNNLTTDHDERTFPIYVDSQSPVRYSTTYSAGAGDGRYKLYVMLHEARLG